MITSCHQETASSPLSGTAKCSLAHAGVSCPYLHVPMGNLMTLFLAGTDTNTQAIMFAIWRIASDETGLQDELLEEMRGFDLENCACEDLSTCLPRLKSFMTEIHRFYSGFPAFILEAIEEITLGGKTVPPRTPFLVLSRYPSVSQVKPCKDVPNGAKGELPCEFSARRWLETDDKGETQAVAPNTTNNASYMAFGIGARACPGRLYSEAVATITLVALLQKYKICLEADHEPVYPVFMHIDTVNCDLKLHLLRRESTMRMV